MDKLKAVIQAMTFWNWIALIAFIFFPLSALNAFFGLRSRYRDWDAKRNEQAFREQLKQMSEELRKVQRYIKDEKGFYLALADIVLYVLSQCMLSFAVFVSSFLFELFPAPLNLGGRVLVLASLFILVKCLNFSFKASRTMRKIRHFKEYSNHVITTIKSAQFPLQETDEQLLNLAQQLSSDEIQSMPTGLTE